MAFSMSGRLIAAKRVEDLADRLEAALHVVAVIAVADRRVERGQFVGMGDDAGGDRPDEALARGGVEVERDVRSHDVAPAAMRSPLRVEEQRIDETDADVVADREARVGIGERDHVLSLDADVQMILIAEMLDPLDLAMRRRFPCFGDPQMLGARPDRRGRPRGRRDRARPRAAKD